MSELETRVGLLEARLTAVEKALVPPPRPDIVHSSHVVLGNMIISLNNRLLKPGMLVKLTAQMREEENGLYLYNGTHLEAVDGTTD